MCYHFPSVPGWAARLRTLSDSFFNSFNAHIEVLMAPTSTNDSYAMRKEDSGFPLLYLLGIKLNLIQQFRNEVHFNTLKYHREVYSQVWGFCQN